MSDFYLTAPDGSFTITSEESNKTFELYDFVDWGRLESRFPPGAADAKGVKIDRNNPNIKVGVMVSMLMSVRYGIDASAGKANEYLSKNPHFETLITGMIDAFEKHKDGNHPACKSCQHQHGTDVCGYDIGGDSICWCTTEDGEPNE